jgi:drug/metabolite transporter (DMT)-like permease
VTGSAASSGAASAAPAIPDHLANAPGHTASRATLVGCGAIALWAFLAVLSRAAAAIPPLQLTAMSFAVSAVLGLALLAARGRLHELRQRPLAWAHGVGGLFGYHALYFTALALAPAAPANLLNYFWPLLIVLLSAVLLGLRLKLLHLFGALMGVAGCALLLGQGAGFGAVGPRALLGYGAALGAAVTWALYSVLSRRMASVPTGAVAGFCAATAVLAFAAHLLFEPTVWPDRPGWLAMLAIGLGPVGIAFFLWDIGMKRGDPRLLGTLAYATPVASTLLLCLAGLAPFTVETLVAAVLVAAGGLVAARG